MGETTGNWALNLEILNAQVNCRGAKQRIKIHDEVNCFWKKNSMARSPNSLEKWCLTTDPSTSVSRFLTLHLHWHNFSLHVRLFRGQEKASVFLLVCWFVWGFFRFFFNTVKNENVQRPLEKTISVIQLPFILQQSYRAKREVGFGKHR